MDTKKLRQKILDLAIRGKLVPQDPNDEPASVLLERIKAEKERLIKEGKIKRSKKSASDTSHYQNVPFEIPESWEWIRLEELLTLVSGQDFPPNKYNDEGIGTPYITGASNIENEQLIINRWTETPSVYSVYGDILVVCKGSGVGKIAMNHVGNVHIARQIQAIRDETKIIENDYIKFCIYSNISDIISKANGLIPGLKRELLLSLFLPIPPLEEQKRIVQEVNNCLALLALIEVNTSDLQDVLRRTRCRVLGLAIRGKLVTQNPDDEPAIDLLKRINPDIKIPCDNPHYTELPKSWCCCKMKDLGIIYSGGTPSTLIKECWDNGNIAWITPADLSGYEHVFIGEGQKSITEFGLKKSSAQLFPQNSVMVSCRAPVGYVAISSKEMCTNQGFKTIAPYNTSLSMYLYYFCKANRSDFENRATGTTFKELSKREFENTLVPIPPLEEQKRITTEIEKYFRLLDNIKESLTV